MATNNNGITTKEYIEAILKEFEKRYVSEQNAQDEKFNDFRQQLKEEDRLLADKYKADMTAYPNTVDFNKLREQVTAAVTKARVFAVLTSVVLSLVVAVATVVVPIWFK